MAFTASKTVLAALEKHKVAIKQLDGLKVEAGWFESARYTAGKGVPEKQIGKPIAEIARLNEYGTSRIVTHEDANGKVTGWIVNHIPARPFMRLAQVQFNRDRTEIQARIFKKVVDGKITPQQALGQIGLSMEGYIVDSIKNGKWPRNAKSTIKKKGFDTPLIDSGQMFKTVASKVS